MSQFQQELLEDKQLPNSLFGEGAEHPVPGGVLSTPNTMMRLQSIFLSTSRLLTRALIFCTICLVSLGCNEQDKTASKASNGLNDPGDSPQQPLPESTPPISRSPSAKEIEKKKAVLTENAISLVADALRGALTLQPPENVTLAPNYLLAHALEDRTPLPESAKSPSTLRIQLLVGLNIDTLKRRFVGLDGSTTPIPLCFLEFGIPTNTFKTPKGNFEVFEFPLKDRELRFLLIHPPRLKAPALAKIVSQSLLAQILRKPLEGRTIPRFVRLPDEFLKPHERLPTLLKAAGSPWAARTKTNTLEALIMSAEYWGPRTGKRYLRSNNQVGRPTWYLVANRHDGGIEAFVALNVAPLPGSYMKHPGKKTK